MLRLGRCPPSVRARTIPENTQAAPVVGKMMEERSALKSNTSSVTRKCVGDVSPPLTGGNRATSSAPWSLSSGKANSRLTETTAVFKELST